MNKMVKFVIKCLTILKKKNKLKNLLNLYLLHKSILLIKKGLHSTALTAVLFQFIEHT